jgi:hypothetical protein
VPIAIGRAVRVLVFAVLTVLAASATAPASTDDGLLPRPDLLQSALTAYHRLDRAGVLTTKLLTVIDYSLPSWERRLWVLDPRHGLRVLFHEFVAHGRGSATEDDPDHAVSFGNEPSSLRSSLGAFLTGQTYAGEHGRSLELVGLDPGVNDKAFERRIVMHPADYVSAAFRAKWGGRVGRSWGCPALDPAVASAVIDRIGAGSLLYAGTMPGAEVTATATAVGPQQFVRRR